MKIDLYKDIKKNKKKKNYCYYYVAIVCIELAER